MLAGELLRLIELHPSLALGGAASREPAALAASHPQLAARAGESPAWLEPDAAEAGLAAALEQGPAALVLALPHGESSRAWPRLAARLGGRARDLALVDLAADHRLRDPDLYRAAYGHAHPDPEALAAFVYGLPELARARIRGARRVAAPGCFATALQLATLPAARAGLLDAGRPWVFAGVTGSSGSGSEPGPTTHHPWRHGNFRAYSLAGHRHEAELAQALEAHGLRPPLCFLAHSGPFARGIHLSAFLPLARAIDARAARALYAEAYAGEPFVRVLAEEAPELRSVSGSNSTALACTVRGSLLQVLCTLDNLVKGGAGQALQCLNLMLGFPETSGLPRSGMGVA
jgi:N-acetyl-gamma-glutamyl-phosphate reductase common form